MELLRVEPLRVFEQEGKRYLRLGYCSRCGECCKGCPYLRHEHGVPVCCKFEDELYPQSPSWIGEGSQKPSCTYRFEELDGD